MKVVVVILNWYPYIRLTRLSKTTKISYSWQLIAGNIEEYVEMESDVMLY
jgi:hypothetical protein